MSKDRSVPLLSSFKAQVWLYVRMCQEDSAGRSIRAEETTRKNSAVARVTHHSDSRLPVTQHNLTVGEWKRAAWHIPFLQLSVARPWDNSAPSSCAPDKACSCQGGWWSIMNGLRRQ